VHRLSSILSHIFMEPKVKNDVKKIIWGRPAMRKGREWSSRFLKILRIAFTAFPNAIDQRSLGDQGGVDTGVVVDNSVALDFVLYGPFTIFAVSSMIFGSIMPQTIFPKGNALT